MLLTSVSGVLALGALSSLANALAVDTTASHKRASAGGTWSTLANITSNGVQFPRQEGSIALVGSDIFYIGGTTPVSTSSTVGETIANVSRYSITNNTWASVASMPHACNHCNVGVVDGLIYVLGGMNVTAAGGPSFWNATGASAVYDPSTDVWTTLPDVPAGRAVGSAATMVVGGTIYLPGGLLNTNLTTDEEGTTAMFSAYNTQTAEWSILEDVPAPRDHAGKGVWGTTLYILAGRLDGHWNDTSTVFAYDINSTSWSTHYAPMPTGRGGAASATIGDWMIVAGGEGDPDTPLNVWPQTQAYNPVKNIWANYTDMAIPVHGTAAVAYNGTMYIPAGSTHIGPGPTAFLQTFIPPTLC